MESKKLWFVLVIFAFVLVQATLGKPEKRLKRKNNDEVDVTSSHDLSNADTSLDVKNSDKAGVIPAPVSPAGSADSDDEAEKKGRKSHRTKHRRPHHKRKHSRGGHKSRRVKVAEGEEHHEVQTAGIGPAGDVKPGSQRVRGHKNPDKHYQRQQRRLERKKARAHRKNRPVEDSHADPSSIP